MGGTFSVILSLTAAPDIVSNPTDIVLILDRSGSMAGTGGVDEDALEHKRGLKTITVPAHTRTGCRDVTVRCIKFVLPEDLDVSGGSEGAICNQRSFKARFFAHYIDHDFACCDLVV